MYMYAEWDPVYLSMETIVSNKNERDKQKTLDFYNMNMNDIYNMITFLLSSTIIKGHHFQMMQKWGECDYNCQPVIDHLCTFHFQKSTFNEWHLDTVSIPPSRVHPKGNM